MEQYRARDRLNEDQFRTVIYGNGSDPSSSQSQRAAKHMGYYQHVNASEANETNQTEDWPAITDETAIFDSFFESRHKNPVLGDEAMKRGSYIPTGFQGGYPSHVSQHFWRPRHTTESSSTSGNSPLFSDLGTTASRSPDSIHSRGRWPRHSERQPLQGLGLLWEDGRPHSLPISQEHPRSEQAMSAYQRRCLEESQSSMRRAIRPQIDLCGSRETELMSVGAVPRRMRNFAPVVEPGDADLSRSTVSARTWHDDHDRLVESRTSHSPVFSTARNPWENPHSMPSLKPLQLTAARSKTHHQSPEIRCSHGPRSMPQDTSEKTEDNFYRRNSPGPIHGLTSSPNGQEQVFNQLRPLTLPIKHDLEVRPRIPCANGTPDLDPVAATNSPTHPNDSTITSTSSSMSWRRRKLPFAELHPSATKAAKTDAEKLFWYGFLGMPWLWLLGGWGLDDTGSLLSPWSTPSFTSYRSGLHPYGPPFAITACARDLTLRRPSETQTHKGLGYLQSQHQQGSSSILQLKRWKHVETYVLYNRLAASLSAFAIYACWTTGIWAVVSHF